MNIEEMTNQEIQDYLEKRKAVKPMATPESVIELMKRDGVIFNDIFKMLGFISHNLDWTPQEQSRERGIRDNEE